MKVFCNTRSSLCRIFASLHLSETQISGRRTSTWHLINLWFRFVQCNFQKYAYLLSHCTEKSMSDNDNIPGNWPYRIVNITARFSIELLDVSILQNRRICSKIQFLICYWFLDFRLLQFGFRYPLPFNNKYKCNT